jgi:hypothetical protein
MTRPQRPPIRLSRWHERWLYAIGLCVLLSGIGWLADHYLFAGTAEFGDARGASEPLWLRLHGAAAMAALTVFGSLFPSHIVRAWRLRKNLGSGLSMLCLVLLLVATGYGLYYAGDEETRPWISMAHWIGGMLAAFGLALHAWLGKRASQPLPSVHRLHRRLFDVAPSGTEDQREVVGQEQTSDAP